MADVVNVKVNDIPCYIPDNDQIKNAIISSGIRINGFRNEGGRNYGKGYFLVSRDDADSLKDLQDIKATITDGNQTVEIENLIMVQTHSLWPTDSGDDAVIIQLVDYRFLSQKSERRLDVDPFPPHERWPEPPEAKTTIAEAIDAYWEDSNIPGTPTLGGVTDYPTIMIRDAQTRTTGSSYNMMNDVLALLSHTLYKTNDGFSIFKNSYVNNVNTDLVNDNKPRLLGEMQDSSSNIAKLPETVRVRYRTLDSTVAHETLSFSYPYGGTETVIPGVIKDIYVYNFYDDNHSNSIPYSDDLDTLGDKIATLFFDSFENHNKNNAVYFGVIPFEVGPDIHLIDYYHDVEDNTYKTEVMSISIPQVFPDFIREHSGSADGRLFPVDMEQTLGSDGDETTSASWSYNIKSIDSGAVLLADVNPGLPPHKFVRWNIGKVTPATFGYAHYNSNGELIVSWCNERIVLSACAEPPP